MFEIFVHPHALKHGLKEDEILFAWANFIRKRHRDVPNNDQMIAIGVTQSGKHIQMVGIIKPFGLMIYHAMTPPTEKMLAELGLGRR